MVFKSYDSVNDVVTKRPPGEPLQTKAQQRTRDHGEKKRRYAVDAQTAAKCKY